MSNNSFLNTIGSVVGAAVGGVLNPAGTVAGLVTGGLTGNDFMDSFRQSQMDAIAFQAQISAETRAFEAISNSMKARHDSAINAIRNSK